MVITFKNVKDFHVPRETSSAFLVLHPDQWVEVTGETIGISVKKTVLRIKVDLVRSFLRRSFLLSEAFNQKADVGWRRRELVCSLASFLWSHLTNTLPM